MKITLLFNIYLPIIYIAILILFFFNYYIFKFKRSVFTSWLVGGSGGYVDNDLVPCGHTFSDMKKYNATTAQNDCIDMIERIRSYWMEQAKSYT